MTLEASHLQLWGRCFKLRTYRTSGLFKEETMDPKTLEQNTWSVWFVSYLQFPGSLEADFLGHN